MINAYSLGFVGVAAMTGLVMDYYNQSLVGDRDFASFGPAEYIASINSRFEGHKREMALAAAESERKMRWKAGGQAHLPEAPQGWERRALFDGDHSAIMPPLKPTSGQGITELEKAEAREEEKNRKARASHSWVYQRGSETLYVDLKMEDTKSLNAVLRLASTVASAAHTAHATRGYAVVGGVSFIEKVNAQGGPLHHFRVLEGVIGFDQQIKIRVHANASTEATLEILEALDYDALNTLLQTPVPHVGNTIKLASGLDERVVAQRVDSLKGEFLQLRTMEANYSVPDLAALADALQTTPDTAWLYAMNQLPADQKAGEADLATLIETGFRGAVVAAMQGRDTSRVASSMAGLVRDHAIAVVVDEAEELASPATMSPELAAELGSADGVQPAASPIKPIRLKTVGQNKGIGFNSEVGRLQLSGGNSCLSGNGRFCD